ncbi:MAG: tRNA (adenosine(37)-N6)-threonylcarbamoyltransferase complex dimerization subunit type 1 TsaB [Deltaproteobacteria bacterium]|nr:tRNA (adenosine(37)-N6)-threonylcarbamoyltransferase complex dimerization subunit type 1 TsaB [Deltaproteobacteria bacterium]
MIDTEKGAGRPGQIVLACDTSTRVGSVALVEDGELSAETLLKFPAGSNPSRRLAKDIASMLEQRGIEPSDIDLLVTSLGPGSFTGVRIAISTMKGLAFALDRPLKGVCSLDALADPLLGRGAAVMTALDARRKEVYCALYSSDGKTLVAPAAMTAEEIAKLAADRCEGRVIGAGEGIAAYMDDFRRVLGDRLVPAPSGLNVIRASSVAFVGMTHPRPDLEPMYCRRSEAEAKLDQVALGATVSPRKAN